MARYTGEGGVIKAGNDLIAEIADYSIEETDQVILQAGLSDTWDRNVAGRNQWSASINVFLDDGASGDPAQVAMTVGATLDFSFYQRGEAPTMVFRKGLGIVATKGGENENNGNLMGSFTITGAAELTIETVP